VAASVLPQQPPVSAEAEAVPQQPLVSVVVVVLPQQPLAAGGLNASAGSVTKPPVVCSVLIVVSSWWVSGCSCAA
jgi:hypothetical protein